MNQITCSIIWFCWEWVLILHQRAQNNRGIMLR